MKKCRKSNRREFLKRSAAGTAGLVAAHSIFSKQLLAKNTDWPDGTVLEINPLIDNLRVAYCEDSSMITNPFSQDYESQSAGVDADKVSGHMDSMAQALAQKTDIAEAWKTIFRKPDGKAWADVKAALKSNTQGRANVPRYPVVQKICRVLVDICGMSAENICVYDSSFIDHSRNQTGVTGTYGKYLTEYPFPDGVKFEANLFSGRTSTVDLTASGAALPQVDCLADLAEGTVDILVNIASNKGHYQSGQVTLTQKNHIGSIKFFCPGKTSSGGVGSYTNGSAEDLVALNKSTAITGGTPARQQLCIVDSLWASSDLQPVANPDESPGILVMGVFGGAVDYLTTKEVRENIMQVTPNSRDYPNYESDQAHFITGYGYSSGDLAKLDLSPDENGGIGWVNALEWGSSSSGKQQDVHHNIKFNITGGKHSVHNISLDTHESPRSLQIWDLKGRQIASPVPIQTSGKLTGIIWDGKSGSGTPVSKGKYILTLSFDTKKVSRSFFVQ